MLHGKTTPGIAGLLTLAMVTACEDSGPTAPPEAVPAFAKPGACPGHPSCDGDDGEDPPSGGTTVTLAGGYTTDSPQPVTVKETGKALDVTGDPVALTWALPTLDALAEGSCTSNGFVSEEDAIAFWNGVADDSRSVKFRSQVDKKALASASSTHFTLAIYPVTDEFEGGNAMRVKVGNHETFGAATYTRSGDTYTLTGGGILMDVLGGSNNEEIASVKCSNSALNGSFAFTLN